MFLWWTNKKDNNKIISEKITEIENQHMQQEIIEDDDNSKNIYLPVGALVMPGKLKLYDPLILKCCTLPDTYICANNLHFKLTHYVQSAFQFRFIPAMNTSGCESVQLESVESPGLFVCISNDNNNIALTSDLSQIANFSIVNGLFNFWHISLKHHGSNKYLMHQNGFLRIEDCDGNDRCSSDATFLPIVPFPKIKLNIILRGHIRNAFLNQDLKILINDMCSQFDIRIFIHSWNIVQSSLSYRPMNSDHSAVDESTIRNYFGEYISSKIKHIMIDDDKDIELLGSVDGFVGNTKCPVKGFKNMLYGKMKIAEYIYNNVSPDEKVVQFRFDILSSPFPLKSYQILDFISQNTTVDSYTDNERIRFISKVPLMGIDNIFMASVNDMFKFLQKFYSHFDEINNTYRNLTNQEFMCFYERNNFKS
jgi:hypothetical protein